jgi:hypothetical protein
LTGPLYLLKFVGENYIFGAMGRRKLTIEECKKLAIHRKGKCLEDIYINSDTKMKWECEKGHIWKAIFDSIKNQETWCPVCGGSFPLTLEYCQELAKQNKGECLSEIYINSGAHLKWRCEEGHEWDSCLDAIKWSKSWCPYCANRGPITLFDCQKLAQEKKGFCLDNQYINLHTLMNWKCEKDHIWKNSFLHIKHDDQWCPVCNIGKTEKLVKEIFERKFKANFEKVRPSWLHSGKGNMELDGYNENLKIAFEYQGRQHFEFVPEFHKTKREFLNLKRRDKLKKLLCKQEGIKLFIIKTVPTNSKPEKIISFINQEINYQLNLLK